MNKFYNIEKKVLKEIIPTKIDKTNLELAINNLKKLINDQIKNKNLPI